MTTRLSARTKWLALLLAYATLLPAAATAQNFDYLHKQARTGQSVCMTDHWHYGEGGPFKARKVAEQQAIKKWSAFVVEEYGKPWGTFERAGGRRIECKETKDGSTVLYTCGAHGRPCRAAN